MKASRSLLALTVLLVGVAFPAAAEPLPVGGPRCRVLDPPGAASMPADDGLRVGTFNLLHGIDEDAEGDYPSATTLARRTRMQAEQLAAEGADVIGLQEVSVFKVNAEDPFTYVSEELAAELASVTGERWWSCWFLANPYFPGEPDIQEGGGGPISDFEAGLVSQFTGAPYAVVKEAVAVVSRYEITDVDGIHLPGRVPIEAPVCLVESPTDPADGALCAATVGFERRSAIWARAATPDGALEITSTHLAHDLTSASDVSSLQQAAAAIAFADAHAAVSDPDAAFFTCDCNSQPSDDVPIVGFIESSGYTNTFIAPCDAPGDGGCTSGTDVIVTHGEAPARAMHERLDYVFARAGTCAENGRLAVNAAEEYADEHGPGWLWPSDHIGVVADVCALLA